MRIDIESVMVRSGISGEWDRDGLGRANVRRRRCARISVVWAAAVFRLGYGGMRGSNLGVVRRELWQEDVGGIRVMVSRRRWRGGVQIEWRWLARDVADM